jgi:serine/threonine protein phosphatase 1
MSSSDKKDGRVLAIGDVHGCDRALAKLLELIEPGADDTVVFLGDVIDRGPSSKQVVDRILLLRDSCHVVSIMGNHEELLRESMSRQVIHDQWVRVGGQEALDSYGGSIQNIPSEHLRFLVSGCPLWETDTEIFIHASLETDVSLANQSNLFLRWKHIGGSEPPHPSGKRVICGHTAQRDGRPLVFEGWVCIDTFVHGTGWLTCLDVGSDYVYQTSQTGKSRETTLSKCA